MEQRKRMVSFLVILSLIVGMMGGLPVKKAEAEVRAAFPEMDITMTVGEVRHVTFL